MSLPKSAIIAILSLLSLGYAFAHKNHAHQKAEPIEVSALKTINSAYVRDVKPIFQKKCFDCHSDLTRYPWYSNLPGAKELIESDSQEAKRHLDFSSDFPFKGHGSPKEDLEEVLRSVESNEMPPFRYRILHRGSKVTPEEKTIIRAWAAESQKLLK
ncbi:MAG: heme-binding domain-containing protein [Bdellovibrionales bacterium]|nr:heme-binding domain-containing protein [Bdellovibrionales bacterium]